MEKFKITFFVFFMILISCKSIKETQVKKQIHNNERSLYIVDTLYFNNPLIVEFKNKDFTTQLLLLKQTEIDTMDFKKHGDFIKVVNNYSGYLFSTPQEFSCILNNFITLQPKCVSKSDLDLQKQIRKSEKDSVWILNENGEVAEKNYKGWKHYEILQRKFLCFLVKGRILKFCTSIDEIEIVGNDNVYYKLLVPITWNDK
ncbi:hypothetical protein [Flavobacterium sp. 3HN19-14]|uniref:hypothetical protein n=1 Tax=Flavobacterium sp. 3HN19-14 TaxID=3448133 RepID=UPI003EDFD3A6